LGTIYLAHQRTTLETVLTRAWLRRGWLACVLWPASLLFGALAALRRALYAAGVLRAVRLPVPVIVVGNVFIGGTGKTPLTIWLVGELQRAGYVPGIISRGYGAQQDAPRAVSADSLPQQVGDEPVLIARRTQCPVMVGRNRVDAARALLAANPAVDVIVSDDGLQHYAMKRDVEILLFDARGAGNGWMLPAGPLREPASRRRDFTVVNADRIPAGMPGDTVRMHLAGGSAERLAQRAQRMSLQSLTQRTPGLPAPRIAAAAGIGNPSRFFMMLQAAGLRFDAMPLPDHYDFADNPFAAIQADIILITEKDAVKCMQIDQLKNDSRLWVVPVTAQIDSALAEKIVENLRGYPTA
jgi:tetraacyldisaccharide 4'-kinase